MKKIFLLLLITLALAEFIAETDHRLGQDLQQGLSSYRQIVLKNNALYVQRHNSNPKKTWKLHLYPQFAALTPEEVAAKYMNKEAAQMMTSTYSSRIQGVKKYQLESLNALNLAGFQYVNIAAVSPTAVRNKGQCKNHAAIAVVDTIDIYFKSMRASSRMPLLSAQYLIDCSVGFQDNNGCQNGNMISSYLFVLDRGIVSQAAYPYSYSTWTQGKTKPCPNSRALRYRIDNFMILANNQRKSPNDANCKTRRSYLRSGIPLTVAIYGSHPDVYNYKYGVISNCSVDEATQIAPDHTVTMVGFQISPIFDENFYILKNTMGSRWGDRGYLKILDPPACENPSGCYDSNGIELTYDTYNKCFMCNIAYAPSY